MNPPDIITRDTPPDGTVLRLTPTEKRDHPAPVYSISPQVAPQSPPTPEGHETQATPSDAFTRAAGRHDGQIPLCPSCACNHPPGGCMPDQDAPARLDGRVHGGFQCAAEAPPPKPPQSVGLATKRPRVEVREVCADAFCGANGVKGRCALCGGPTTWMPSVELGR